MNICELSCTRPCGETGFMYHKSVEQLPKYADLSHGLCMCSCRAPPQLDGEFGVNIWLLHHCWDFEKCYASITHG